MNSRAKGRASVFLLPRCVTYLPTKLGASDFRCSVCVAETYLRTRSGLVGERRDKEGGCARVNPAEVRRPVPEFRGPQPNPYARWLAHSLEQPIVASNAGGNPPERGASADCLCFLVRPVLAHQGALLHCWQNSGRTSSMHSTSGHDSRSRVRFPERSRKDLRALERDCSAP